MTAREDPFTPIHKGLRSMIYGLSSRLQTHDFADLDATRSLVADFETDFAIARNAGCAICILSQHAEDENSVFFVATAPVLPELTAALIAEHHELTRRELALGERGHRIVALSSADDRVRSGVRFNAEANELFVAYLAHMNREDTELVPRMQERFTDAEMIAMRGRIIASMPPERLMAILRHMLPSLNVTELSELLAQVRPGLPPPAFQAITNLCEEDVDAVRWDAVKARVGI